MPTQIGSRLLRSSSAHCARKWRRVGKAEVVEEEEEEEEEAEQEEEEDEENSSDKI